MLQRIRNLLLAGLLVGVITPSANAVFMITITETGGPPIVILDGDPIFDLNLLDPSVIEVNTLALNPLLLHYQFASLSTQSNSLLGVPFSSDSATLTQTGTVDRTLTPGFATIDIVATDTDYLFPALPGFMDSSASDTFTNTAAGTSRTFQSFFGPANLPNELTVPSPLLAFIPPIGLGPFSTSGDAPTTPVPGVLPYSLTNWTSITNAASASLANLRRDQFTGATTVVPEPSTLVLSLLGLPLLAARRLRRLAAI